MIRLVKRTNRIILLRKVLPVLFSISQPTLVTVLPKKQWKYPPSVLKAALHGGELSASRSGRSAGSGEEKLLTPAVNRTADRAASHLTD